MVMWAQDQKTLEVWFHYHAGETSPSRADNGEGFRTWKSRTWMTFLVFGFTNQSGVVPREKFGEGSVQGWGKLLMGEILDFFCWFCLQLMRLAVLFPDWRTSRINIDFCPKGPAVVCYCVDWLSSVCFWEIYEHGPLELCKAATAPRTPS